MDLKSPTPPPKVSIIVLNFNGEGVIEECLEHLLKQTMADFDIIVVDNHSTDTSFQRIENYLGTGRLSVVRSPYNRGCPGGRNLGRQYAQGEFVAFIDNDGYACPDWLEAALQVFQQDPSVGAVASVVFFNKNKAVLNGAGGTVNWQGYGGDHGFFEPYEFAQIPTEVLYPMGCGMVVRRTVLDRIGPLDDALLNYYDDTELGYRVWKSGYRVVVAPRAWVNHEFNYSSKFVPSRGFLVERGRIRTALKYFPPRHMGRWLWHEASHILRQRVLPIQLLAWAWNLIHLVSALHWRSRFPADFEAFDRLVSPTWGWFPYLAPAHRLYQPQLQMAGSYLTLDDQADGQLVFGWYAAERDAQLSFRWTAAQASAVFCLTRTSAKLSVLLHTLEPQSVRLIVRRLGATAADWEMPLAHLNPEPRWQRIDLPCRLQSGMYELLVLSAKTCSSRRRAVGVGVGHIEFV